MYLRDILNELNLKMSSKITENEWIAFLNSSIRRYGRHLASDDLFRFNTAEGVRIYPLPPYIGGEGIKSVTVGGRELLPARYGEETKEDSFCLTPTGFLMLSFKPHADEPVLIMVAAAKMFETAEQIAERSDGSEAEQKEIYDSQNCGVYDEYIDAVIYGALAGFCEATEDITAANNYISQADGIVRGAVQSKYAKRGKYPVTKAVSKWRR